MKHDREWVRNQWVGSQKSSTVPLDYAPPPARYLWTTPLLQHGTSGLRPLQHGTSGLRPPPTRYLWTTPPSNTVPLDYAPPPLFVGEDYVIPTDNCQTEFMTMTIIFLIKSDRRPDSGGRGGYNCNVVLQDDHYYRHSHSRDTSPDRSDGDMYDYDYNEDAD